jgi:hypothetical protein
MHLWRDYTAAPERDPSAPCAAEASSRLAPGTVAAPERCYDPPGMAVEDVERSSHFHQLKWSLQGLAGAGSQQPGLFPEYVPNADDLAFEFDHTASLVRARYEPELSASQSESLTAIERKLATLSRDGAEFDIELWTDAAVRSSSHWADVRRLAAAALEAFGWPLTPPAPGPGDQGSPLAP